MEILIKRNDFEKFMEFLIKNQIDDEWKIFLVNLYTNIPFLSFTKDFLIGLKSISTLRKFLYKIFSKISDITQQQIQFDIISNLRTSNSLFAENQLIRNLYIIQIFRLALLDNNHKDKIILLIRSEMKFDTWFLNLLETFAFYEELAYLYESMEDYKTALKYYKMSSNNSKIDELSNKLLTPIIEETEALTDLSI
jgi:hypothetical protein